jgi:outer membrane protein TolC
VTPALALVAMVGAAGVGAPLTEAEAVATALRNSPQVKFRGHFVDEAKALTDVGLSWNNPHLRVGGMRYDELVGPVIDRRTYGDHPFYHTSVALRWSPPDLGERGARRAEGLANEANANMELAIARRDTAALVRRLHAQILNYDEQLTLDREVIDQRAKLRALVKSRIEQQAATLLEQSLTEVDYLDARTELAEIEVRRRAAYDELLVQLGLPAGETVQLATSNQDTCTTPEAASKLAERAHAANPRLRLIEAQDRAVDAERTRRWLDLVPWFDYLQVGYGMAGDDNPVTSLFSSNSPCHSSTGSVRIAVPWLRDTRGLPSASTRKTACCRIWCCAPAQRRPSRRLLSNAIAKLPRWWKGD